jgi:hypothetical protein
MEKVLEIIGFLTANWMQVAGALTAIVTGAIAIALLIPGEQPEKFLQKVLDFITKFSRKP